MSRVWVRLKRATRLKLHAFYPFRTPEHRLVSCLFESHPMFVADDLLN